MNDTELEAFVDRSLNLFLDRESANILSGVSERNLCGRLSVIMEQELAAAGITDYFADPEYNRKQGGKVKTIISDEMQVLTITCDLIVHSRGSVKANDNLVAIEMKKANRPRAEKESDIKRLGTLTKSSFDGIWSADGVTDPEHVCGSKIGLALEINRRKRIMRIDRFSGGGHVSTELRSF